jgi:hypothetical protein
MFWHAPPDTNSELMKNDRCILGLDKASNNFEAILHSSKLALNNMARSLSN